MRTSVVSLQVDWELLEKCHIHVYSPIAIFCIRHWAQALGVVHRYESMRFTVSSRVGRHESRPMTISHGPHRDRGIPMNPFLDLLVLFGYGRQQGYKRRLLGILSTS